MGKLCIYVFAVILIIPYSAAAQCKGGWIGFEDSCYYLSHGVASWAEAGATCKILGGSLAVIETSRAQNFLKSELNHIHQHDAKSKLYWIGGTDLEVENVWRWISTGQTISFTDWAPGQPNAGENDNCMDLWGYSGFQYADDNCELHFNYVCQIRDPEGSAIVG